MKPPWNEIKEAKKKYFVYCLRDSLDKKIFYVGKGSGKRPSDHLREAARYRKGFCVSNEKKCKTIVDIQDAGRFVAISILKSFEDEAEAYIFEHMLIELLKMRLTNRNAGSNKYMRMAAILKVAIPQYLERLTYWKWYYEGSAPGWKKDWAFKFLCHAVRGLIFILRVENQNNAKA